MNRPSTLPVAASQPEVGQLTPVVDPGIPEATFMERLLVAMDNLNELFVMWGPDDCLVTCNSAFQEFNADVAHAIVPGTPYETYLRAAQSAGLLVDSPENGEAWIEGRLQAHRHPGSPEEVECHDGRWLLVRSHRLEDGYTVSIASDITARKHAEASLQEGHRVLQAAIATIPDGVHVLDADLKLTAWNDKLWEVMDLDGDAILASPDPGKAFRYALAGRGEYGEGDLDSLVARREEIARTPVPVHYERQLVTGKWIECRGTPVPGGGYVAVYRDITDQRKQVELERLAAFDDLTGLRNRRSFLEILSGEFERCQRYDRTMSVILIDVDWFKNVNDRFGHAAGDAVLRRTGEVLTGGLRGVDTLARYGGEEFALLLPESVERESMGVAERLRSAVEATVVETGDTAVSVTISLGVSEKRPGDNIESLLARADAALYVAKKNGRNQVALSRK